MKFKFSLIALCSGALLFIFLRFLQITVYTDYTSGFFLSDKSAFSWFLIIFVLFLALVISFLLNTTRRCPRQFPKMKLPLALSSAFVSFASFVYAISDIIAYAENGYISKITTISVVINIAMGILFFLMFVSYFLNHEINSLLYCFPMIYWLFNIVMNYIKISKMALIGENVWMILATASATVFSLEFAEVANKIKVKNLYKKVLISGFLATSICIAFSLPQIVISLVSDKFMNHNSFQFLLVVLAYGVFAFVFLLSFFDNSNLPVKKKYRDSSRILPY